MARGRVYRFDTNTGRYRDQRTGRLVCEALVRRAIDTVLRNDRVRARVLAEDLRAGRTSRFQWAADMRQLVREVHLYSAAAAHGGWRNMDPETWGRVGAAVQRQNQFLDGFTTEVMTTLPLDGRFTVRAMSYVDAGRSTFHRVEQADQQVQGKQFVRNILVDRTHSCSECPDLTARGLIPIAEMPPPGERQCLGNCRCTLEYAESAA